MAKLTKSQIKAHKQALDYLAQARLTEEEREFAGRIRLTQRGLHILERP